MPSIESRKDKNNKTSYRAKVRVKGYPPVTATFAKKTDAKHWAQQKEAEMRADKYFPNNKAKKHTVCDLIDLYLKNIQAKNSRRHDEVKPMLDWWKAELKDKMLYQFTGEHVSDGQQKLLSRKKERKNEAGEYLTLSSSTVNRYMAALHTAIQFGIKPLKWIHMNPVNDVDKLKEPPGRTRCLNEEELKRLIDACKSSKNPHIFAILILGLATGARREEIRYMRWMDVNADNTLVTLPKTKNGDVRGVHLTGIASELIKKMRANKLEDQIFLFPSLKDPTRPIDFESAWRTVLKNTGIKDFRFHDNRHTCASYLAMNGASLLVIAETLGHKDLQMVRRYAHLTQTYTSSVIGQMTGKVLGHVEI